MSDLVQTDAQDNGSVIGNSRTWQPIETAQRDREILVSDAHTGGGFMQVVEWDEDRRAPYNWAVKDGSHHHKDLFTHWMPLPACPELEAQVTAPKPQGEFETKSIIDHPYYNPRTPDDER